MAMRFWIFRKSLQWQFFHFAECVTCVGWPTFHPSNFQAKSIVAFLSHILCYHFLFFRYFRMHYHSLYMCTYMLIFTSACLSAFLHASFSVVILSTLRHILFSVVILSTFRHISFSVYFHHSLLQFSPLSAHTSSFSSYVYLLICLSLYLSVYLCTLYTSLSLLTYI